MECFDDLSQLEFYGIYKSENTKVLTISLSRCYGAPHCKSEDEIRDFIDKHSVYVLYNDQTYNPNNFDIDKTIEKTVKFENYPLEFET